MRLLNYLPFLAILGLLLSCAKLGKPPGGPKDEEAPFPIKAKPANYSTDYSNKKIVIKFNEFLTLKNQFSEFTISPPLEEKPIPLLRGKDIHIDLPANELDSLTYTMDFGQSIADNNEGNPLPNFQFVISKNAFIDSFSVKGMVVDAFTHLPDEDLMYVFLNRNHADSVPYTTIPSYLGRSNPEGFFEINHVAPGTYSVFALKDANNNMLYDLPTEIIAYLDETITLHPDSFPEETPIFDSILVDSTISDSLRNETDSSWTFVYAYDTLQLDDTSLFAGTTVADSLLNDSITADSSLHDSLKFKTYGLSFNLYSFIEEEPYSQYLTDYNRNEPEKLVLFFNEPQDSLPAMNLLYPDTVGKWYHIEKSEKLDTLIYWLADSNLVGKDSIIVEIIHPLTDTNGITLPYTDTLLFRNKSKKKKDVPERKKRGLFNNDEEEIKDTLPIKLPRMPISIKAKKSAQDLNVPLSIITGAPIVQFDENLIKLFRLEDTLEFSVPYRFDPDTSDNKKYRLFIEYEPLTRYIVRLYEGAFIDIYGRTIDSTETMFTTQRDDFYGIVNIDMQNVNSPVIVQIFNKSEKMVNQKSVDSSKKITFDFLPPDTYSLKMIFDDNNNGKWDTGNLQDKIQPERVDFYKNPLEVRSNWEVEYVWEIIE